MGFNILMVSERLGHEKVDTTWNTYAHLYPDKDKQIAYGLQEAKLTGITQNQSAENQMTALLTEIEKYLPNYSSYKDDTIVWWDPVRKEIQIITREYFDKIVAAAADPQKAYINMMEKGYYSFDKTHLFCFASKGVPIEFL